MPCLLVLLLLGFPRVAFFCLWLFGSGYLQSAIERPLLMVLGFLFMPLTSIAFAYAFHGIGPVGAVSDLGWVIVGVAGAIDLGLVGGGARSRRRRG